MSALTIEARGIVTHEGWAVILPGHNLPLHIVAGALDEWFGGHEGARIEEHWYHFQRRVMWCGNYGDACDLEGEWHSHWHEVRPNPAALDARYTVAYPVEATP